MGNHSSRNSSQRIIRKHLRKLIKTANSKSGIKQIKTIIFVMWCGSNAGWSQSVHSICLACANPAERPTESRYSVHLMIFFHRRSVDRWCRRLWHSNGWNSTRHWRLRPAAASHRLSYAAERWQSACGRTDPPDRDVSWNSPLSFSARQRHLSCEHKRRLCLFILIPFRGALLSGSNK